MNIEIKFDGKPMTVHLTHAAETVLLQRSSPLVAELELYFSCMIRKRVRFHTVVRSDRTVAVTDHLSISFRPVMTRKCQVNASDDADEMVVDFPITKPSAYVP